MLCYVMLCCVCAKKYKDESETKMCFQTKLLIRVWNKKLFPSKKLGNLKPEQESFVSF